MTETASHSSPINLNVDNLIHCINRDQAEADLWEQARANNRKHAARERDRWSDTR